MRLTAVALAAALAALTPARAEDGDPARGAEVWKLCTGCHSVGEGAKHRVGPHLNDLFGRPAASIEGYRYSRAMERAGADGLKWTPDSLNAYVENPRLLVTGTRMAFPGIADPQDRTDLLAYLRAFSASPRDIPEAPRTAEPRDPDLTHLVPEIEGDPAWGEYLAGECLGCHQADGAYKGIPSITGWPQRDFVLAMQAYKRKLRPHPVMRMIAGNLSDEEIAALAAYFEGVQQ